MILKDEIIGKPESAKHAALMNQIYQSQSGIYDLTRKYYLLGRDELIEGLKPPVGSRVLEVGCGTARNLILAKKAWPQAEFYGLDISSEMLMTARKNLERAGLIDHIKLFHGDAEDSAQAIFGGTKGFDRIFLSFCLSMIPDWQTAIRQSLTMLEPDGELHIVDFGQLENLPSSLRFMLRHWLALFHVEPREYLGTYLRELDSEIGTKSEFIQHYRGYSWRFIVRQPNGDETKTPAM